MSLTAEAAIWHLMAIWNDPHALRQLVLDLAEVLHGFEQSQRAP